jgi:peptidoglycan/LPS O-acetylase OafA/YrhL
LIEAMLAASFLIALGFAVMRKRWFLGWLLGSMVAVVALPVVAFFTSTTWLGPAMVFGTVYCMVASGVGLFAAWLVHARNDAVRQSAKD